VPGMKRGSGVRIGKFRVCPKNKARILTCNTYGGCEECKMWRLGEK
jgi:hypothetical protein